MDPKILLLIILAITVVGFLVADLGFFNRTAHKTEKMLSVDNLFVILLIFSFSKLEEKYYHRVLFWGILGAIVFRATFILAGSYIIDQFHWVLYIFGAILLYTGIRLLRNKKEEHVNFHDSKVLKFARKFLPFTTNHHGCISVISHFIGGVSKKVVIT